MYKLLSKFYKWLNDWSQIKYMECEEKIPCEPHGIMINVTIPPIVAGDQGGELCAAIPLDSVPIDLSGVKLNEEESAAMFKLHREAIEKVTV